MPSAPTSPPTGRPTPGSLSPPSWRCSAQSGPSFLGAWNRPSAAGPKLGLGAVLLGGPGIGCQIEVDQERRVARAEGAPAERLVGLRLFGLAADEAMEVLGVLAQAEERPESGPADADNGAPAAQRGRQPSVGSRGRWLPLTARVKMRP